MQAIVLDVQLGVRLSQIGLARQGRVHGGASLHGFIYIPLQTERMTCQAFPGCAACHARPFPLPPPSRIVHEGHPFACTSF